jgi:LmbE family N-acetylglucosaminyl deacetylase
LEVIMRVLAVGAHPDDLEILCGGTLAKYAKRGDHVSMAVATNGEVGSPMLAKQEIAEIRRQEAAASAKVIGADFYWMNYPDEFLFSTEHTRLAFLDLVRQDRPDVIITHAPTDYHPDHRTTGGILWDIRVMTTVPNISTEHPPCKQIPEIFYMETVAGIDFVPQHYVDIGETFSLKREMLACHKSQSIWLEDQYQISYLDMIEITGRYRGFQCGVKYAEGLQTSPTWPKWTKGSLLP